MKNEDMYRWHDLRENPDDLPEMRKLVIVCIQGSDVICPRKGESLTEAIGRIQKIRRTSVGYLSDDGWCNHDGYPMIVMPIAWKSIEPFESEE